MVRIDASPIGDKPGQFLLPHRVVCDDFVQVIVEDIEHLLWREVQIVEVGMVGDAVAPVRAVQLLDAVELGVTIEKEELRGVEVAVVIDLVPATLGYIDGSKILQCAFSYSIAEDILVVAVDITSLNGSAKARDDVLPQSLLPQQVDVDRLERVGRIKRVSLLGSEYEGRNHMPFGPANNRARQGWVKGCYGSATTRNRKQRRNSVRIEYDVSFE
ncbi:hypothetical protein BMS3Bbin02_01542 [bacterium BMS3Bbin02]|nr:hypothetical protein BMS3Bbin02_01542 [bacterium BMS3Bbin02]